MTLRPSARNRARRALAVLTVPLLALLLSGCFKFDMDLALSDDQTVSGSLIFGLHRDTIDFARQFDENASIEDLLGESGLEVQENEGITAEPYEDDSFVGYRYVLDQVPLETINQELLDDDESLQIVYHADRDVYEVSGTMDLSDTASEGEDVALPPNLMAGAEVRIAITFPGEVLETNGEVSGTTVTWRPQIGEVTELHAVASASGTGAPGSDVQGADEGTGLVSRSGSTSALVSIVVALAVVLVILAVVLIVWLARRNRAAAAPAAPGSGPTVTAPGASGPYADPPAPGATQAYPPSGGEPPTQQYPPAPPPPANPQ